MRKLYTLTILLLAIGLVLMQSAAQDDNIYTDPSGHFSLPVPEGWSDESSDQFGHFVSPDGRAHIYVAALAADDVDAGIGAALALFEPGLANNPLEVVEAPLPNGTWQQNLYVLASGELLVLLCQVRQGIAYVAALRGPQAALPAVNQVFLDVLNAMVAADRTPPYANHDLFTETEITLTTEGEAGGWSLPGTLTLPVGEGPFPALVLVHGSGPNDRDETIGPNKPFRDLAWGLASMGIAVLRYDKRTLVYGIDSARPLASGTVYDETIDDALTAVNFLRAADRIDPTRIVVLGHSLGGYLAPRIGAADPEIAGLVILAGLTRPFADVTVEQFHYIFMLDGEISPDEQAVLDEYTAAAEGIRLLTPDSDPNQYFMGIPAAYWLDLQGYDPVEAAVGLAMPMLILQGERDYQVTMVDFENWRAGLAGRDNVTLISYPALNHVFIAGEGQITPAEYSTLVGFVAEEVVNDIAAWILDL